MLAGVVIERQERLSVVGDLGGCFGELGGVDGLEGLYRGEGMRLVLSAPDLCQGLLRARVRGLGQRGQDIRRLMEPAALSAGLREDLAQRAPESERSVPGREHRGAHAPPGAVAQQVRPRLRRLAVAISKGDQLLAPISAHADHHQQAQLVLFEADVHMDPVGPQIDIVHGGQVPGREGALLCLPGLGQPGDHRRRQARRGAEELAEGGHEVPGRQAVQVQQRQHLGDLRGLPRPGRQDRRGEPLPLTRARVGALVVDPRHGHLDRAGAGQDLPRLVIAVAHHQPAAVLIPLRGVRGDIGIHLGGQRLGQHPPGTLPHDLIDQRRRAVIPALVA